VKLRVLSSSLATPAGIAAILDMIPIAFPFLAPGKNASTGQANFVGQVLFFHAMHLAFYERDLLKVAVQKR
jgi:hypothetical protein